MNLLSEIKETLKIPVVLLLIVWSTPESSAQCQDEEIRQLKEQLNLMRAIADSAKLNAEHLRFRTIASSMAIKSTYQRDPQTQGLVTLQAFKFYEKHRDPNFLRNNNIYTGIYQAMRKLYGDSLNTFIGHTKPIKSVISGKEATIYSASNNQVLAWNLKSENRQFRRVFKSKKTIKSISLSENSAHMAVIVEKGIVLLDLSNPKSENKIIYPNDERVSELAFLPDNSGYISSSGNNIWKSSMDGVITKIGSLNGQITNLAINPDGSILAAANEKGIVEMWDLSNNNQRRNLYRIRPQSIDAIAFSEDSRFIAFGSEQGGLVIYDLEARQPFFEEASAHAYRITDIEFSPNSRLLATSSEDGTAKIWSMNNFFDFPIVLGDHFDRPGIRSVAFLEDGSHVITGGDDTVIKLWPTSPNGWANRICDYLSRNMTRMEWLRFVGKEPYPPNQKELTCPHPSPGK